MKKPFRIAVLASTRGTDLQAIIDELKAGKLPGVELSVVLSNKKDCYALQRAREQGFKAIFVRSKGRTREEFDQRMQEILDKHQVDLIVLVGYMRLLSKAFVNHFRYRILNVHPALLPKYGGGGCMDLNVHEEVLKNGDTVTGMTIHFVTEVCDGGPIVVQKEVAVDLDDTPDTLKDKVQALEKKWYPEVIRWIQHGKVTVAEE